jgi:outer membrane immunogenic protein
MCVKSRIWRTLLAGIALVAVPMQGALAADREYPLTYVAVPAAPFNWSGAHVGLSLGYDFDKAASLPVKPNGVLGGIQGGYDWQTGRFVFGAESDLQLSSAGDTFAPYKFSNPWFGTVRGRLGWAFSNILLYGTGGLVYGEGSLHFAGLTETHMGAGWTAGGGVEIGFRPHWSAKVEYLYFDLGQHDYVLTSTNDGLTANLLRFGFNYRF